MASLDFQNWEAAVLPLNYTRDELNCTTYADFRNSRCVGSALHSAGTLPP